MLRLGSKCICFHSKSGVLSPWCSGQVHVLHPLPDPGQVRAGDGNIRCSSSSWLLHQQLLAGTHCPGLPHGWERKRINLSPKLRKGESVWAEGCQGRSRGGDVRWETGCVDSENCLQASLKGEGYVHSVFPMFLEMMEAWSREFSLKTKFTGIKSFWFLWWRLVSRAWSDPPIPLRCKSILELLVCVCVQLLQLCQTLCDSKDCSPPGPSVHGILQATILSWPCNQHQWSSGPQMNRGKFPKAWYDWEKSKSPGKKCKAIIQKDALCLGLRASYRKRLQI